MNSIVIIDDDEVIAQEIFRFLEDTFRLPVHHYSNSISFLASQPQKEAVYLIDWHLPDIIGADIVKVIRKRDQISTIFMMSGDNSSENIKRGLSDGADDFLIKPFSPDVLLAKINASQSRIRAIKSASHSIGIRLLPESSVVIRDGVEVALTCREFEVFKCLYDTLGETKTREDIVPIFKDQSISVRSVDQFIFNLRKKIDVINFQIESIRGKGYRMVDSST